MRLGHKSPCAPSSPYSHHPGDAFQTEAGSYLWAQRWGTAPVGDGLRPDIRSGFSSGKRLRERIGVALGFVGAGGALLGCGHVHRLMAAQRAGDALGQNQTMVLGSSGTEPTARGHPVSRPRRPPPPRVSALLHAGPPRCPSEPCQLPAARKAEHASVWGHRAGIQRGQEAAQRGSGAPTSCRCPYVCVYACVAALEQPAC